MPNPYKVLGVHPEAEEDVIEAAYRTLSKKHHPDSGGSEEEFKRINEAYEEICSDDSGPEQFQESVDDFDLFGYPVDQNSVKGGWSDELTIEGQRLTMTLLGVYKTDVSDLAYNSPNTSERYIIILNVVNTSDNLEDVNPLERMKVIGSDDFSYDMPARGQFDVVNYDLPPRMTNSSVKLEPGSRSNIITIAKGMPEDVYPEKIVHRHKHFQGDQIDGVVQGETKFEFDLEKAELSQLKPLEA